MTATAIAILLLVASFSFVALFLTYKRHTSKRRLMRMLVREGLEPELAQQSDPAGIMRVIRQRCNRCQSEDLCERWLANKTDGDNQFCPNAGVFEILRQA